MDEIPRSAPTKGVLSTRNGAPAPIPNPLSLICRLAEIPSTNTLCAHLIEEFREVPELLPTGLLFAGRQTAGRGRGDHAWISPAGGMYFSIFFRAEQVPAFLPLTTGLFWARWLGKEFGLSVKIRWPNDLLLEGRKLGGLLCENKGGACIIGVGLNVNATVVLNAGSLQRPSALKEVLGREVDLAGLCAKVQFQVEADFLTFILDARNLSLWDSYSALSFGRAVTWKAGGRLAQGTYLGITSEGHLKVETGGEMLELSGAEDVFPA